MGYLSSGRKQSVENCHLCTLRLYSSGQFPFSFSSLQSAWLFDINAQLFRLDLPDRASKPFSRRQAPAREDPNAHNANSHRRVVQRLGSNGVGVREAEDDRDERDP